MMFVGESKNGRPIIFGYDGNNYFYIEFTGSIEIPKIEKKNLSREVLISLLEKNLDNYSKKGLNVVMEKI